MKINLVPMAGEGQRYKDACFTIPKPFIDMDGMPMAVRACKALPKADKNIFVCRKNKNNILKTARFISVYLINNTCPVTRIISSVLSVLKSMK